MSNKIKITKGNKLFIELRGVTDQDDAIVNFTGCSIICSVFVNGKLKSQVVVTSFSSPTLGNADIEFEAAVVETWPTGIHYYQIDIVDASGDPFTIDLGDSEKFGGVIIVHDFQVRI